MHVAMAVNTNGLVPQNVLQIRASWSVQGHSYNIDGDKTLTLPLHDAT